MDTNLAYGDAISNEWVQSLSKHNISRLTSHSHQRVGMSYSIFDSFIFILIISHRTHNPYPWLLKAGGAFTLIVHVHQAAALIMQKTRIIPAFARMPVEIVKYAAVAVITV
jgi:hypothetical protein